MTTRRTRWGALLAAPLLVGTLAACDPPPPPPVFHVDSSEWTGDQTPGDGTCADWRGACTLGAAIEEADAQGRGQVLVPPGEYEVTSVTVSGDVTVSVDAPGDPTAYATVTGDAFLNVVEGGRLVLRSLEIDGSAWSSGSLALERAALSGQITVTSEGVALLVGSFVGAGVVASGRLVALSSTVVGGAHQRALYFTGGDVILGGTALLAADGNPACQLDDEVEVVDPISIAPSFASDASCNLTGPGDLNGSPDDDGALFPAAGSPRIDAIPVGTLGCGTTLVSDIRAFPRPTDGDGDGVAACDIGAWER